MLIKKPSDIASSEITPPDLYARRRNFLTQSAAAVIGAGLLGLRPRQALAATLVTSTGAPFSGIAKSPLSTADAPNSYEDITTYNNFYEFSTDKAGPARLASGFIARPWTVRIDGEVAKDATIDLDTLFKESILEERIYRFRCVEAWSMVIPWVGVPLASILKKVGPKSSAKYVVFETLHDPARFPGQKRAVLSWPYREGLRMDEAMHPLTILAVGIYGKSLLGQNGAPVRLVVPWKYGFKSIKSIVRITLAERQPPTTWQTMAPGEYGFYANVNPEVDHPRWSQARERRIGNLLKQPTHKFNGYGDQVASMYAGIDLTKNY